MINSLEIMGIYLLKLMNVILLEFLLFYLKDEDVLTYYGQLTNKLSSFKDFEKLTKAKMFVLFIYFM